MKVSYDKEYDILYLTFSQGTKIVCIEDKDNPNILFRYDLDGKTIVGVTVMEFVKHVKFDIPQLAFKATSSDFIKHLSKLINH